MSDDIKRLEALLSSGPSAASLQLSFVGNIQNLHVCQKILEQSDNLQLQMFAGASMLRLCTTFWPNLHSLGQTMDLRNYLLTLLASRRLHPAVASSVTQVVMRLAKLGWMVDEEHRSICNALTKFLQHSVANCILGLRMYRALVAEMNDRLPTHTPTQHRAIANSFSSSSLLLILQIAVTSLKQIVTGQVKFNAEADGAAMLTAGLQLWQECLAFDFLGIVDESVEDVRTTIQVPTSWRSFFEDGSHLALLFEIFCTTAGRYTVPSMADDPHVLCLGVLADMAFVRRGVFGSRQAELAHLRGLVQGTTRVFKIGIELLRGDRHHRFSRLLCRMKLNFLAHEFSLVDGVQDWLTLTAGFTFMALDDNKRLESVRSIHYLVLMWSKFAEGLQGLANESATLAASGGSDAASKIHAFGEFVASFVPKMMHHLMMSRVQLVPVAFQRDELEELFDEANLAELLEALPALCRCSYGPLVTALKAALVPPVQAFKEGIAAVEQATPGSSTEQQVAQILIAEAQVAWVVYIMGALVGNVTQAPGWSREEQEALDADIASGFFKVVPLRDFRQDLKGVTVPQLPHLDAACLYFMHQFGRRYLCMPTPGGAPLVSEQTAAQSFTRVSALLNDMTVPELINRLVLKIVASLHKWAKDKRLSRVCLELLDGLTSCAVTVHQLLELPAMREMLTCHTAEHYAFHRASGHASLTRMFYNTLARICFRSGSEELFDAFMAPLEKQLAWINSQENPRSDGVAQSGAILCSALAGITSATFNSWSYSLVFEWLYPRFVGSVLRLMETWWDNPAVTAPVLRLFVELTHNKLSRISFPVSSPNSIILFREASKAIETYGRRMLPVREHETPDSELFKKRLKGLSLCLELMENALSGEYVNFGVFALYNDRALVTSVSLTLQLALAVPLNELVGYGDLVAKYMALLELLFRDHAELVIQSESKSFAELYSALREGVRGLGKSASQAAVGAIDNLFAWRHWALRRKEPPKALRQLETHLAAVRPISQQILFTLMDWVLQEDMDHFQSVSHAILGLAAVQGGFEDYGARLASLQAPESRERLATSFGTFTKGLVLSHDRRNADEFTSRLDEFRSDVSQFCVIPA